MAATPPGTTRDTGGHHKKYREYTATKGGESRKAFGLLAGIIKGECVWVLNRELFVILRPAWIPPEHMPSCHRMSSNTGDCRGLKKNWP